jgi:hypothetical protein
MTSIESRDAHGSGERWKHEGHEGFQIGLGLHEDNNTMSCVLVYYDALGQDPPTRPFICQGGMIYMEDLSRL